MSDDGSAVVESTMVTVLVLVLFLGVLQVGLAFHVRATLASAAAEGARHGAATGSSLDAARARARLLATDALAASTVEDVVAERDVVDGLPVVRVRVTGRLPVLGPWGIGGGLQVEGLALQEDG